MMDLTRVMFLKVVYGDDRKTDKFTKQHPKWVNFIMCTICLNEVIKGHEYLKTLKTNKTQQKPNAHDFKRYALL